MKKIIIVSLFFIVSPVSLNSMESQEYSYRLANIQDSSSLLEIINTQAAKDEDKIVIVPQQFRQEKLEKEIAANKIFVAVKATNEKIVAFKKLYLLGLEEQQSVLESEIRCIKNLSQSAGQINMHALDPLQTLQKSAPIEYKCLNPTVCIYNGADFTCPAYRQQGINKQLTNAAFEALIPQLLPRLNPASNNQIALVYGVVEANSGSGLLDGRSKSIVGSFIELLKKLPLLSNDKAHLLLSRYEAYKPSFDPLSKELKPLPDTLSIYGYGYLLLHSLKETKEIKGK